MKEDKVMDMGTLLKGTGKVMELQLRFAEEFMEKHKEFIPPGTTPQMVAQVLSCIALGSFIAVGVMPADEDKRPLKDRPGGLEVGLLQVMKWINLGFTHTSLPEDVKDDDSVTYIPVDGVEIKRKFNVH